MKEAKPTGHLTKERERARAREEPPWFLAGSREATDIPRGALQHLPAWYPVGKSGLVRGLVLPPPSARTVLSQTLHSLLRPLEQQGQ